MPEVELEIANLERIILKDDLRIEWLRNEMEAALHHKETVQGLLEEANARRNI